MKNYKTLGIVLKRTNFNETDKILTIFTNNYGKLHLLAKGVRKTTSKKAPSLEPFMLAKLFVASGRNLDIILEAETINNFRELRKDLKKVATAYKCLELVDKLCPEKQVNRSLFILLEKELTKLNNINSSTESMDLEFIHPLLWDLGYLPKGQVLEENKASELVEELIQRKLKSDQLLTKIESLVY